MSTQVPSLMEKINTLPPEALTELETLVTELQARYGVMEEQADWTEADMRELTLASLRYAAQSFGEEE